MKNFFNKKIIVTVLTLTALSSLGVSGKNVFASDADSGEIDTYTLDPIVVTATKVEEATFRVDANVSVITKEKLENKNYENLTEVLRDVSGVTINNYGNGGGNYSSNSVYINGSASVVFLIDGVRVSNSLSKFSAAELVNMDIVERIEVLKGSASTLYGSDAAGGVINIITKKTKEPGVKTSLSVATGSFSTQQYKILNSGRTNNGFYWSLNAQKDLNGDYRDGKGNTVRQKVDAETFHIKVGKDFDANNSLVLSFESHKADYLRPSKGGIDVKTISEGKKDNSKISMVYNSKFSKHIVNQLSIYKNKNYLEDNYNTPNNLWLTDFETIGVSDQITHTSKHHTLVAGFDFYQDKVKNYYSESPWGAPSQWGNITITSRAFYLQDIWRISDQWKLTSGIRSDNHSTYGSHTTPSFSLGYNPNEKLNLYMSYKEFFVSPDQFKLYSSYGNINLKPETGDTVEFGVKYKFDKTSNANFSIFQRNAENMIGYNSVTSKYYNIGEEKARGWEIQFNKAFNENFSANIGYTQLYIDPETVFSNPNRDGFLPKSAIQLSLDYQKDAFDMHLNGRGTINRDGRKIQNVAKEHRTFWVWDASFNYKIKNNAKIFIKVNNILDEFYSDRGYDLYPDQDWYSSPGRNFQIGVNYTF